MFRRIDPVLVLMLLLGAALRLWLEWSLKDHFFSHALFLDPESYDTWAMRILREGWLGRDVFYQDPLYPYFLAMVYRLFGHSYTVVRMLQYAMGIASAACVYEIARRWYGRSAARWSALLMVTQPVFYYYEWTIQKSTMGVFLLCVAALLYAMITDQSRADRSSWLFSWGLGLVWGLLLLVRGNFFLFAPMLALLLLLRGERAGRWKQGAALAAWFCCGVGLVLGATMARNAVVSGEWVTTTAQGGQNFYIGNHAEATGTFMAPPFVVGNPRFERSGYHNEAERRLGRTMTPKEVSGYWYGQSFAFIRSHPAAWLGIQWKKLEYLFSPIETPDNHSIDFLALWNPTLKWLALPFPVFAILALLGFPAAFLRKEEWLFPVTFLVVYAGSLVAFFVVSRYRLPLYPMLILGAGLTLAAWQASLEKAVASSSSRVKNLALVAVSCVLCGGVGWLLLRHPETVASRNRFITIGFEQVSIRIFAEMSDQDEKQLRNLSFLFENVGGSMSSGEVSAATKALPPGFEQFERDLIAIADSLPEPDPEAALAIGACKELRGAYEDALEYYARWYGDADKVDKVTWTKFHCSVKAGDRWYREGKWIRALIRYEQALSLHPGSCPVWKRVWTAEMHRTGGQPGTRLLPNRPAQCIDGELEQSLRSRWSW